VSPSAARAVIDPVARFLKRFADLRGKRILLALSGGADSVALLHALIKLRARFGFELAAAHLNHGLRGAESNRDEAFVRALCNGLGVELTVDRAHGLGRSPANLEARARAERHRFLNLVAARIGADYIALAHQANDQAETVMLRLLRGAGVTGLGAMTEVGPGRLIRPMLAVRRSAVLAYLAAIGATFVEDSTNAALRHDRNRVRHLLMPMLERDFAPGLSSRLVELATEMRQVDDWLAAGAEDALADCLDGEGALDLGRFKQLHPAIAAAALRRYLGARVGDLLGFDRTHIEALRRLCLIGPPNGSAVLPGYWRARRRYGKLMVVRGEEPKDPTARFEIPLTVGGVTVVEPARTIFESALLPRARTRMPHDQFEAVFDAQAATGGLVVRNFTAGDRIAPLGVSGTRKLKDIFIERKVPRERRQCFPVVVLDGRVAWLPGLVRSNVALITGSTTKVLRLSARDDIA
jgi:tRNA(Ile)-lysidine synthase